MVEDSELIELEKRAIAAGRPTMREMADMLLQNRKRFCTHQWIVVEQNMPWKTIVWCPSCEKRNTFSSR